MFVGADQLHGSSLWKEGTSPLAIFPAIPMPSASGVGINNGDRVSITKHSCYIRRDQYGSYMSSIQTLC